MKENGTPIPGAAQVISETETETETEGAGPGGMIAEAPGAHKTRSSAIMLLNGAAGGRLACGNYAAVLAPR